MSSDTTSSHCCAVQDGYTGITFKDCTFVGSQVTAINLEAVTSKGSSWTMDSCNIQYFGRLTTLQNGDGAIRIINNYMANMFYPAGAHNEWIYHGGTTLAGSSVLIQNNTMIQPLTQTAVILLETAFGNVYNFTINANLLQATNIRGTCYVFALGTHSNYPTYQFTNNSITNNAMLRNAPGGYDHPTDLIASQMPTWSGNYDWITKAPIPTFNAYRLRRPRND